MSNRSENLLLLKEKLETLKTVYGEIDTLTQRVIKESAKGELSGKEKKEFASLKCFNFYPQFSHVVNMVYGRFQSKSYRNLRNYQLGLISNSLAVPPKVINDKWYGAAFAKKLDLPLPEVQYDIDLKTFDFSGGYVVKPRHSDGGKCIFAISKSTDGTLVDHFSGKQFSGNNAFFEHADELRKISGVKKDAWMIEEMVTGEDGLPTSTVDVKFYCFYGEVPLVLQVDRWAKGGAKFALFDEQKHQTDGGLYKYPNGYTGVFNDGLIDLAKRVSKKIPWPFVRIDFLVSPTQYKFGEFTLRPGSASRFNDEWDMKLADSYNAAFARLYADLLNGKRFNEYNEVLEKTGRA